MDHILNSKTLNNINTFQTQQGKQRKEQHSPYQVFTNSLLFPRIWPLFQLYFQMFQEVNKMSIRTSHLMENHCNRPCGVGCNDNTNLLTSHDFTDKPSDVSFPTKASNWQLCLSFCRVWPCIDRTRIQVVRGWWVAVGIYRQLEEPTSPY